MNKYIDLWNKKNEYVSKLEPKLAEVKEEERVLNKEEMKLNETRFNSERELQELGKYEEENARKAMLILEIVIVAVLSFLSIPILTHLNFSIFIAILTLIATNAANVGIMVTVREALARYYQELREKNKYAIAVEQLTLNNTKRNLQDNYAKRVRVREQEDELIQEIKQEKEEITKLGNTILQALTKLSENDLGTKNELLDKLIAKELASKEGNVIDINMKRERTLNK